MWILWIVIIIVGGYALVRGSRAGTPGGGTDETPLDILKKRYARGEITKEEFDRIKKELD